MISVERRSAIVRLWEVLTDGLPVPARAPLSTLGFVHRSVARESCADCLSNGFVSSGCETCGGRGHVEVRRSRDPYDTGQSQGWFASSAAKHARDRDRDAEIVRLGVQVAAPRPEREIVAAAAPEGWEVARDRLRAEFHVVEAERALARLAVSDIDAYRAVHAVHVYGYLPLGGAAAALVERAVVFVDPLLPDPLRAPAVREVAAVAVLSRGDRDREIRRLDREEVPRQWIANRFGVSVSRVSRIVNGVVEDEGLDADA